MQMDYGRLSILVKLVTLIPKFQTYLLPYILNQKDENDEKIDQLQTSVSELKESLSQTGRLWRWLVDYQ